MGIIMNISQILASSAPSGLWENLIFWFESFIGNYGWTLIVFTILLKIVLLPLDFVQKKVMANNNEKMAVLQPKIEKIKKQYGDNKELINQKTMELYKSENYNVMGSCFAMLINLVLTLVIFITLFNGIRNISYYKIGEEFATIKQEYIASFDLEMQTLDSENADDVAFASSKAQESAKLKYDEIRQGFLWISNVWISDTSTAKFPSFESYVNLAQIKFDNYSETNPYVDLNDASYTTKDDAYNAFKADYEKITAQITANYSGWNGYYILVVLAGLVTWLSQYITKKQSPSTAPQVDDKGNPLPTANTGKIMAYVLPAVMVLFTLQSSTAFSLYIVTNSIITTLLSLGMTQLFKISKQKKELSAIGNVNYSNKEMNELNLKKKNAKKGIVTTTKQDRTVSSKNKSVLGFDNEKNKDKGGNK